MFVTYNAKNNKSIPVQLNYPNVLQKSSIKGKIQIKPSGKNPTPVVQRQNR